MADVRRAEEWQRTAWLCHIVANCSFGASRPQSPEEFNPYAAAKRPPKTPPKLSPKESLETLHRVFG